MTIKTAYSRKDTIDELCAELYSGLNKNSQAVIYFGSTKFDPKDLAKGMEKTFQGACVFGCTTAGEIVSGKMLKQSVVAMSLPSDVVEDISVQVVENITEENQVPKAFQAFQKHYGKPVKDLDIERYVGIILVDGLRGAEEKLMEKIGDLTDLTFIGASAGDDLAFKQTYVFANGKAYTNAAVLALMRLKKGFDIIKTQSFCSTGKKLVATQVDEATRTVLAFNNQPAAQAYAEALGIPAGEAANHFMHAPVGLMDGDEPYVRSPQQVQGEKIVFYCKINQGMELDLLESTDIIADTEKALKSKLKELGGMSGIINFHCILRTLELESKGITEPYGKIFTDIPTIGFSTYGEEYIGHINQTSTILVFK
ncbi:MAG: FIST C-terminal domain-containing protein [Deltaproteobacteria bacterium]|nr:FIST C-terminal domain-containing protein [Deltaproteobacteria bacterium]